MVKTINLYDYARAIVKNFLKKYYFEYKNKSLDINDLVQESHIIVWGILNDARFKNKPNEELRKIVSQAVGWRLKILRRESYIKSAIPISQLYESDEEEDSKHIENETCFVEGKCDLNFDELKQLLSQRDYEIIYKRFFESKTFEEIGKELNLSHQGVKFILEKILKRLKKFYFKKT